MISLRRNVCLLIQIVIMLPCLLQGKEMEKIQSLDGKIMDGTITLNDQLIEEYILTGPRDYHFFVLMTATPAKFRCDQCQEIAPEYTMLCESYAASNAKADDGRKIYFGLADYPANSRTFSRYGVTSAPTLFYIPPAQKDISIAEIPDKIKIPDRFRFDMYSKGINAERMAQFVEGKTGASFPIHRSMIFIYFALLCLLFAVLFLVRLALMNMEFILERIRRKKLWMVITTLFYGLSVSGMVFCIIRNPPPFMRQANGAIKYFHPQGRQQFVFEGLIVGFLNLSCAFFIIILTDGATRLKNRDQRFGLMLFCLIGFYVMHYLLCQAYIFKNPWYARVSFF